MHPYILQEAVAERVAEIRKQAARQARAVRRGRAADKAPGGARQPLPSAARPVSRIRAGFRWLPRTSRHLRPEVTAARDAH
jgi:hypothetical protein